MKLLCLSVLLLGACATRAPIDLGVPLISESEYTARTEQYSRHYQAYVGLYSLLDLTATWLSSNEIQAELQQKARIYAWDRAKFQAETNLANDRMKQETRFFLSFFTPEPKNDDLQKPTTQWRVYLEAGGHRWEGKVKRIRIPLAEIQSLYVYNTRFYTPYEITFPVGTKTVDSEAVKFTITGPVAAAELSFSP